MPISLIPNPRPEVHGHRGCRGLRPENTLLAFLHALTLGVDVLELDVVVSADRQVVVSHEPWFNPAICTGPGGNRLVAGAAARISLYQLPYAAIRQYDCGQLQHPDFPEQLPAPALKPLLREVFAAVESAAARLGRPPVGYSVEIKSTPAGDHVFHPAPADFLALVLAELVAAGVLARTTLLCFDARILRLARQQSPALATSLLVEDARPWTDSVQRLGFVPDTLGPNFRTVTPVAIQQLRNACPGIRLVPWTVNTPADMQRLRALPVDGITTDYPDRLLALLST